MILCVYALVAVPARRGADDAPARAGRAGRRIAAAGVCGEPLSLVQEGSVAAVVGRMRQPPSARPARLRQYDATVAALASQFPALLPARFGTWLASGDELAFVLRERQQTLRPALARVRHRAQMTIRIVGLRDDTPPRQAAVLRGGRGTRYLRRRAAEAAGERAIPGFEAVGEAVRRWVRDERVERRAQVATVYHLIPRAAAGRYRAAATRAATAAGLQVVITGPWAPYAFGSW